MTQPRFVDYSGSPPILLPLSILRYWCGFYLAVDPDDEEYEEDEIPDLELPEGALNICDDFDFENPKTDYDRACSLGALAIRTISVGPGEGLVFSTELDPLTWWPEVQMLVNGRPLPELANLAKVEWSDELTWQTTEEAFLLMNACDHGCDPDKNDCFEVRLESGSYTLQRGDYGWEDDDPSLVLFRFVRQAE